uniref:Uncharacterized protein n=1 Tax=Haptolina ericina TaxID=156174 RepID=A0A7S3BY30_9EUKA
MAAELRYWLAYCAFRFGLDACAPLIAWLPWALQIELMLVLGYQHASSRMLSVCFRLLLGSSSTRDQARPSISDPSTDPVPASPPSARPPRTNALYSAKLTQRPPRTGDGPESPLPLRRAADGPASPMRPSPAKAAAAGVQAMPGCEESAAAGSGAAGSGAAGRLKED